MTEPSASLHATRFFCINNAELVKRAAALIDLKLPVGSGFPKQMAGMDSLDKHVEQISFRE